MLLHILFRPIVTIIACLTYTASWNSSCCRLFDKKIIKDDAWPTTTRGNRVVSGRGTGKVISRSCDISYHHPLHAVITSISNTNCSDISYRNPLHAVIPCIMIPRFTNPLYANITSISNSNCSDISYHIRLYAAITSSSNSKCRDISYHHPLHAVVQSISNSNCNDISYHIPLHAVTQSISNSNCNDISYHNPWQLTYYCDVMMGSHLCVFGDRLVCDNCI